jgi:hypothetical protein
VIVLSIGRVLEKKSLLHMTTIIFVFILGLLNLWLNFILLGLSLDHFAVVNNYVLVWHVLGILLDLVFTFLTQLWGLEDGLRENFCLKGILFWWCATVRTAGIVF